jgi:16S rRNA processing protein RimM
MSRHRTPSDDSQENAGSPQPGEPVFLVIGKLRRPHGVSGEMLMDVLTDFPQRLRRKKTVFVGERHEPLVIETIRTQDKALLLSFEGITDCDAVGRLRNDLVYIRNVDLPKLPEGEYYYHQLLDLRVVDDKGQELGILTEILETGANDVYVVHAATGEETLLPVIEGVILNVDLERGEILVHPPEWS